MLDNKSLNSREEQALKTKQKLMDSAKHLFSKKGYKGTSVREINRSVNLADGLLYHYFPGGKKEIFKEVVQSSILSMINEMETKNSVDEYIYMPLEEVIECAYLNAIEVFNKNMDIIRIVFRDEEVREFITQEQIKHLANIKEPWFKVLLKKKCEMGEIINMDFECAAMSLGTVLMNYVLARVTGIEVLDANECMSRKRYIAYQVSLWKRNNC